MDVSPLDFDARSVRVTSDVYVVAVTGEADLYRAEELERELQAVYRRSGRVLVLDLTAAPFIDSTVLGLLVRYEPKFRARGGTVIVVSDDRRVLRTLEITGLKRIFRIERDLRTAVAGALESDAYPLVLPDAAVPG